MRVERVGMCVFGRIHDINPASITSQGNVNTVQNPSSKGKKKGILNVKMVGIPLH